MLRKVSLHNVSKFEATPILLKKIVASNFSFIIPFPAYKVRTDAKISELTIREEGVIIMTIKFNFNFMSAPG